MTIPSARGKRSSLKRKIYIDLKDKLIHCVYPPGSEINGLMLTEEYGVSRTPIREVVSRLEAEGYVRVLPKKGIYVNDITIDDVLQIFNTRLEIEPITLRMALPYLNTEELLSWRQRFREPEEDLLKALETDTGMHLFLIDQCGNDYMIEMMHRLFDDNTRTVIATGQTMVKIHNAVMEQAAILDAIITRQPAEVCTGLMRRHLEHCREEALKYFSSDAYLNFMKDRKA